MKDNETPTNQLLASGEPSKEEEALTVLRTETALSRFPLHHIAKKGGDIEIDIHNQGSAIEWNVSYNTKYGPPGPLAYRIDTLLVNRHIEATGKPVPRLIKLGTLPEIAQELGISGNNWNALRRAFHQNASAYITAKISYRTADRTERFLEAGFNRYNVIFTGEKLPSGDVANAVHLVLSDIFLDVLNTALWRPLDYDYMKALPPGPQRFYEIVSYQIYGALHFGNPRAKITYSEYCLLSTATRYFDFEHVKKQMYKIVRPHIQSGYLAKVEYESVVNERDEPDWIIYLTPGINADREYRAFTGGEKTRKNKPVTEKPKPARKAKEQTLTLPFEQTKTPSKAAAVAKKRATGVRAKDEGETQQPTEPAKTVDTELVEALVAADLNRSDAERFATAQPEACRRQLIYLRFVSEFKTSRGAYLRRAIESDFGPPAGWVKAQDTEAKEKALRQQRARALFEANQEKAREGHLKRFYAVYLEFLKERVGEIKKTRLEAFVAFSIWEEEQRAVYFKPPFAGRAMNERAVQIFDREESHLERFATYFREQGAHIPTFWEWDESLNPESFKP